MNGNHPSSEVIVRAYRSACRKLIAHQSLMLYILKEAEKSGTGVNIK